MAKRGTFLRFCFASIEKCGAKKQALKFLPENLRPEPKFFTDCAGRIRARQLEWVWIAKENRWESFPDERVPALRPSAVRKEL